MYQIIKSIFSNRDEVKINYLDPNVLEIKEAFLAVSTFGKDVETTSKKSFVDCLSKYEDCLIIVKSIKVLSYVSYDVNVFSMSLNMMYYSSFLYGFLII